jgi:hypothetical protein
MHRSRRQSSQARAIRRKLRSNDIANTGIVESVRPHNPPMVGTQRERFVPREKFQFDFELLP